MRLSSDIRGTLRKLLKKGLTVTRIAYLFDTTRQTAYRWLRRCKHLVENPSKIDLGNSEQARLRMRLSYFILLWLTLPILLSARQRKVERCIQNQNREFVNHLRRFPGWLKGKLYEYEEWFNYSRFYRGINTMPAELYECNVRKLT